MSSTPQLQRGRACHECRRRKLKCTAERPTCDNCRRAQNISRGNPTGKKCTYDRAPEDERWEHWSSNHNRDQQSKHIPSPPPRTSPATSLDSVEIRETQLPRPPFISAPSQTGSTALPPPITSNSLRTSYDGSATPYPVDIYNDQGYFMAYAGNPRPSVSMRDHSLQPVVMSGPPEFIDPGTLTEMMFHPDHNQFLRYPYERPSQPIAEAQIHSIDLAYMQHDVLQTAFSPRQVKSPKILPNHGPRFI
ncbi:hypothetical protein FRC09_020372 [Ceratobasidium sp. 395]|nr:hypothetical protein FRC09_020372 [Ceratobasidium sp. 395]